MVNLLVDIGNSDICYCIEQSGELSNVYRVKTHSDLDCLFSELTECSLDNAIMCSVVPDVTTKVSNKIKELFGVDTINVTYENVRHLLDVDFDEPDKIGADRLCDCMAAKEIYGYPAIVCDFGTATNIEVLDDFGVFIGGILYPGIEISCKALYSAAAKLKPVELKSPSSILGKNTADALISGIVLGEAKKIDGLILQIVSENDNYLTKDLKVIATGGLAPLVVNSSALIDLVDVSLTLKGLSIILKSMIDA